MWFYSCSFVGPGRPGWLASCWSLHKCCHHEALSWPRHLCSWCKKRGKEKADPPLGIGEKYHQGWRYHRHINCWHHTTIPVTRVSGQCSRLHRVLLNSWLQNVSGNRNGWHCLHCSHCFHRFHCLCCLHWFPCFHCVHSCIHACTYCYGYSNEKTSKLGLGPNQFDWFSICNWRILTKP